MTTDKCPECRGGIHIAIGNMDSGAGVFRLECATCGWSSEALPDPEVNPHT